ncbi:hypothetical protein B4N89_27480 [Embleya scabrispora]|uniref:Uncharacterized protein n=1 Tax=Embleya scabrispora TaxID=159449 RepID=A0A1T3P5K8_9ACTN|nr:hypothetical protein [Embleya scabrispora]OPC84170.1 hypothetical protein B4N89_27480 [Embleya scabrispora]
MTEPTVRTTRHEVSLLPEGDINAYAFAVEVTRNRRGTWSVLNGGHCLADGAPGHPDGGRCHIDHRYDEDTAIELAKRIAPHVTVMGLTVAEALARGQAEEADPI